MEPLKDRQVLLSFGSNLGNAAATFQQAAGMLKDSGFRIVRMSAVFRSPAWDCEPGAPDFSNCAVLGFWDGEMEPLLDLCQQIEIKAGRPADHPYHHSRTLDIDILLAGDLQISTKRLTIPHKAIPERAFYLIPSAEIAPEMIVPGLGLTIGELAETFR